MPTTENKVEFGLRNTHYAVVTVGEDGKLTFGTPKPIPGSVSLTLDKSGDMVKFKADDIDYYRSKNNQGYEGTLNIARVPDEFKIDVLGETKTADGVMIENADAKGNEFALLFEFQGDVKAVRHVMYYCSADRASVSSTTKDSGEPNTSDLAIIASPRPDTRNVKANTRNDVTQAVYDNWFVSVYEVTETPETPEG
jgi:phi13 family phage major tail protein